MADLSKVSVGIKTFLRNSKLINTIDAISRTMPDAKMIIADCGDHTSEKNKIYADLLCLGHQIIQMDFDAGFGAMSNAIAGRVDTPYLLIGSDDFNFDPPSVRTGIEKMLDVLENSDVDIASGRVRGPYEFDLEDLGSTVIEHKREMSELDKRSWYVEVDLTVNFSIVKKHVFDKVRWLDSVKICGGEHGANFISHKRAGHKVAWVPQVQITEQEGVDSLRYQQYRRRCGPERPAFDAIGVRKYVLATGQIDYEVKA
jgi:hypothetical protein